MEDKKKDTVFEEGNLGVYRILDECEVEEKQKDLMSSWKPKRVNESCKCQLLSKNFLSIV